MARARGPHHLELDMRDPAQRDELRRLLGLAETPGPHPTPANQAPKRRGKYGAVRTEAGGLTFDSRREADAYLAFRERERRGEIRGLRTQVSYDLRVNGVLVCRYVADFVYYDVAGAREVVADAKGYAKNRAYRLKKRLMAACLGIEIEEV